MFLRYYYRSYQSSIAVASFLWYMFLRYDGGYIPKTTFMLEFEYNRTGGVMVSVLASSAVDRGFEPRSGQTKDNNIGVCCFSAKYAALRRKSKLRLIGSESE